MARPLNDTQRLILTAAAARPDLHLLPLPTGLRAPPHVVTKSLKVLIADGLGAEVAAQPGDDEWMHSDASGPTKLVATAAGLAAIGVTAPEQQAPATDGAAAGGQPQPTAEAVADGAGAPPPAKRLSKSEQVIDLLRRKRGTSIEDIVALTGWKPHTVRAFLSVTVIRKKQLPLVSQRDTDGVRRYHVATLRNRQA